MWIILGLVLAGWYVGLALWVRGQVKKDPDDAPETDGELLVLYAFSPVVAVAVAVMFCCFGVEWACRATIRGLEWALFGKAFNLPGFMK